MRGGYQPPPDNPTTIVVVQQGPSWRGRGFRRSGFNYSQYCIIGVGFVGGLIMLMGIIAIMTGSMNNAVFADLNLIHPGIIVGTILIVLGILLSVVAIALARSLKRKQRQRIYSPRYQHDIRRSPSPRYQQEFRGSPSPMPQPGIGRSPSPRQRHEFRRSPSPMHQANIERSPSPWDQQDIRRSPSPSHQPDMRHSPSYGFERASPVPFPGPQMMRRSPSPRRLSPSEAYDPQPTGTYPYSPTTQSMGYLTPDPDPPPPYNPIAPPPHQMPLPSAPGITGDSSMAPGIEDCPPPPYSPDY